MKMDANPKDSMSANTNRLPAFLHPLFWEYDLEQIDCRTHSDIIMARIMTRGNWQSAQWLRRFYEPERLISFLQRKGRSSLPPRELNYWALIAGVSDAERSLWIKQSLENRSVWSRRHAY